MSEMASRVYIDLRADAHEELYDHEWASRMFDCTRGTPLAQHVFALCELWKSTSNAFRMPWFLLITLNEYHDSIFTERIPHGQKIIQALIADLANDAALGLRRMQAQRLASKLQELDERISTALHNNPPKFDRDEAWQGLARSTEFALGTASLREMCHSNLLFGYEHYCKSCLDSLPAPANSPSQKSTPSFKERFVDRFGQRVFDETHDSEIMLAREVRHAFVHNGGRVDQKLKAAGINLPIGEKVTITVDVLRDLSEGLRNRVNVLTDASLKILNR